MSIVQEENETAFSLPQRLLRSQHECQHEKCIRAIRTVYLYKGKQYCLEHVLQEAGIKVINPNE